MFGDILGTVYVGEKGVPVHVYDNDRCGDEDHQYHAWDGVYGLKWECVELARRYLYLASDERYMLPYVDNAVDLWDVLPGEARFRNTDVSLLMKHSVVVFDAKGEYEITGHVAIVVDVISPGVVDIVEQNMSRYRRTIDVSTADHVLGWFNLF